MQFVFTEKSKKIPKSCYLHIFDQCIRKTLKDKACGPDNLCAEHLIYAHPSTVVHLESYQFFT